MGWASGSTLFHTIITAAMIAIPDNAVRKQFYISVIEAFEQADWDTMDECIGVDEVFDEIYMERYPDD